VNPDDFFESYPNDNTGGAFITNADSIFLTNYTVLMSGLANSLEIYLGDNSQTLVQGPVTFVPGTTISFRLALYDIDSLTLVIESEEVTLTGSTTVAGVYVAPLLTTFPVLVGQEYWLAEWFSVAVNQPYNNITDGADSNAGAYPYSSTGYPFALNTPTNPINFNQAGSPIALTACVTGGVGGDPSFVGLQGQHYQVHGIDGATYNLISDEQLQVNSKFVFLKSGKCPIIDGFPAKNCFSHPGSYMGSVGVQQWVDNVVHRIALFSGDVKTGFSLVEFNGQPMKVGQEIMYQGHGSNASSFLNATYVHSHRVDISTPLFSFTFENSDLFINQVVTNEVPLSTLRCHGLFGQTRRAAMYHNKWKYIEGDVDDYIVLDDKDLFGTQHMYNQFIAAHSS